jgi:ankyrin repeat protein
MARWLIERGANDFSVQNFQGKTPLEVAQARGDAAFAALLKEHTAGSA